MCARPRLLPALGLAAAMCAQALPAHRSDGSVRAGSETALVASAAPGDPHVVVYGGTPAGVAAAIAAANHRARVVLLTEGGTVGGMMSNGVSASDVGSSYAVTGIARTFFDRIKGYYRGTSEWRFEPRIAERVFMRMLGEAGVEVRRGQPLLGVRMNGRRVACVQVAAGEVCAPNFIDASYTGDVVAAAGVPHRLGMNDLRSYGENMALRRTWSRTILVSQGLATAAASAFRANPYVRVEPTLPSYDQVYRRGTPSLTYRLCVTDRPENRLPFTPFGNYQPLLPSFRVMARGMADYVETKSNGTLTSDAFNLAVLPGGKYDLNAGFKGLTNLTAPSGYFRSAADRADADRTLRTYVQSFFWFAQRDATVPPSVRETFRRFGLCADEFADNGGWPRQPYVREGRRIVGRDTLTVGDVFINRRKADTVAVGAYYVDGKQSQWVFASDGGRLDRDLGPFTRPPVYEIPFAAMVPTFGSVTNLLAPVGLSASPTAYGSVRMEPQYMALGQAAGAATALASREALSVAALPASRVQSLLRYDGVAYSAASVCQRTPPAARRTFGFSSTCALVPLPTAPPTVAADPADISLPGVVVGNGG